MTTPRRSHIDLHAHTARSDGVLEPQDLYAAMRAWGSTLVAITDHDTLAAPRELRALGMGTSPTMGTPSGPGPRLIPGVEINTRVDDAIVAAGGHAAQIGELHILGLGVDLDDAAFEAALDRQRDGRRLRIERTLARLAGLGLDVRSSLPEVPGGIESLGRPHVARALVRAGHAASVEDAFDRYLEPGAPAYVPRQGLGPRAAIETIRAAGGVAVLAHAPWAPDQAGLIERLTAWGLDGLEVHYRSFDEPAVERMAAFARQLDLLATGGTDYHGDDLDYATAASTAPRVPDAAAERLLDAIEARGQPRGNR